MNTLYQKYKASSSIVILKQFTMTMSGDLQVTSNLTKVATDMN